MYGWISFTCDPNDNGAEFDVSELYHRITITGQVPKMPQSEIDKEVSTFMQQTRNSILFNEVDPIVSNPLRWSDLSQEQQQAWANYRKELLDLPQQEGFPHEVQWPERPAQYFNRDGVNLLLS
jgi:hypothetical protein